MPVKLRKRSVNDQVTRASYFKTKIDVCKRGWEALSNPPTFWKTSRRVKIHPLDTALQLRVIRN